MATVVKQLSGKHTRCVCGIAAVAHPAGTCILSPEDVVARAQQESRGEHRRFRGR